MITQQTDLPPAGAPEVDVNTAPDANVDPQPKRFTRLSRALAYILSPKILIGGILAYAITLGVDVYRKNDSNSREDVRPVSTAVSDFIKTMPKSSTGVAETTSRVEDLYISHPSKAAQEYIAGVVGQLSVRKAKYLEDEQNALKVAEALRVAQEAKTNSEAAAKLAEEARVAKLQEAARLENEAKLKAAAAEEAKREADRQTRVAAATKAENSREAKAYFDQRRYDRMPK